jgi:undecaprenyl-phosphate 4-deoxy-4-formamido-L-arabinose transferase
MNKPFNSISVVVPVYNSEVNLPILVERLEPILKTVAPQYELIMVNDGSMDDSWKVIQQLSERYPWLSGIHAARYEVIVTIDDDLQNPPEEIPKLLSKLSEGYDVVYGTPEKEQHGFWRDRASQITKLALQGPMGAETARNVSAFRAFRKEVCNAFSGYQGPFVSIDVLLTWGTNRFSALPVRHDTRRSGISNYTFRKLVTHALNMMTGFSTVPLQMASMIGFVFTLFGVGVLLYVTGRYLIQGGSVAGFPFLASIIAIFSGAQLFALGIIGEYLARMHFRSMGQPPSVIRRYVGFLSKED